MASWYKSKMDEQLQLWQEAVERGDKQAENYHMQEHFNYSEAYHRTK